MLLFTTAAYDFIGTMQQGCIVGIRLNINQINSNN